MILLPGTHTHTGRLGTSSFSQFLEVSLAWYVSMLGRG
jgi:hypothetical protein